MHCPGQCALEYPERTTQAAQEGTRLHKELIPAWIAQDLPDTPRGRTLAKLRPPHVGAQAEIAYAINFSSMSARRLHPRHPRDYSEVTHDEVPGTIDIDSLAECTELKFGEHWVEPPRYNPQMWHAVVAIWLIHKSAHIPRLRLVQVGKAGYPRDIEYQPTIADILTWYQELKRSHERVFEAREALDNPRLTMGEHCRRCNALQVCPLIDDASPETPADRYIHAQVVMSRAERELEDAENALGVDEHLATDGTVLKPSMRWTRQLNVQRVLEVLPGLDVYVEPRLSCTAIDQYAEARPEFGVSKSARRKYVNDMLYEAGALAWVPGSMTIRAKKNANGK